MIDLVKVCPGEYESPEGDEQLSINKDEGIYENEYGLFNFEIMRDLDGNFHHIHWDITPTKFEELEDIIIQEIKEG